MIPRRWPGLRWPRGGWAAGGVILSGLMVAALFGLVGEGSIRYTAVPRVEMPLPPRPTTSAAEVKDAPAGAAVTGRAEVAPAPADPALVEPGTFGPLPRIGPDGRRPVTAYARPFEFADPRPRIAILIQGLGLHAELTGAAMALPEAVTLQFSPYATDLPALVERARAAGHEVMLGLPMEPEDYPASDPGPHTLLAEAPADENAARLAWLMAQAQGYVGLAGEGGRFAASARAEPVLRTLAARGLGLVEVGDDSLRARAQEAGLPYVHSDRPIDDEPSAMAIDFALADLETAALETGSALGVAQPYPVSLERLRAWAETLPDKGLVLAPVSALLIENAGLAERARGDGDRRLVSQG